MTLFNNISLTYPNFNLLESKDIWILGSLSATNDRMHVAMQIKMAEDNESIASFIDLQKLSEIQHKSLNQLYQNKV